MNKLIKSSVFLGFSVMNVFAFSFSDIAEKIEDTTNGIVKVRFSSIKSDNTSEALKKESKTIALKKDEMDNFKQESNTESIKDKQGKIHRQELQSFTYYYVQYVRQKGLKNLTQQEILYSSRLNDFKLDKEDISNMSPLQYRKLLKNQLENIKTMLESKKYQQNFNRKYEPNSFDFYNVGHFDVENNYLTLFTNADLDSSTNSRNFLNNNNLSLSVSLANTIVSHDSYGEHEEGTSNTLLKIQTNFYSPVLRKKLSDRYVNDIVNLGERKVFSELNIFYKFIFNKNIEFIDVDGDYRHAYLKLNANLDSIQVFVKNQKIMTFNSKEIKHIPAIAKKYFFNKVKVVDDSGRELYQYDDFGHLKNGEQAEPGHSIPTIVFKNTFKSNYTTGEDEEYGINLNHLSPQSYCKKLHAKSVTPEEINELYILKVLDSHSKYMNRECNIFPVNNHGKQAFFSLKSLSLVKKASDICNPICTRKK